MKKKITLEILIIISSLIAAGCSELESNLTSVTKPSIHGDGALNINSSNFHANYFTSLKFTDCQNCHAKNFQGGLTPVNCSDASCHPAISIHANSVGVMDQSSQNFHGRYLLKNSFADCQQCHGENFAGGFTSPSCVTCHSAISVHKTGILDPSSANFHGKYPLTSGFTNCQQCHGENFSGGLSSPTCRTCHGGIDIHKEGILNPGSADFHGKFMAAIGWNLTNCRQCHGVTYSGGIQSPSCLTCHNQTNGPEACNTCHGNFNDPARVAPPNDLAGSSNTTSKGVGAHDKHLFTAIISSKIQCSICHSVPQTLNAAGHLDGTLPAEVILTGLAVSNTAANASYNYTNFTCSNSYCHGKFEFLKTGAAANLQFAYSADKMEGNNRTVQWNKVDGSEAACGTCHGLPPVGHTDFGGLNTCANCHTGIVDAQGNIIDKTKHMNGVKNVFGN